MNEYEIVVVDPDSEEDEYVTRFFRADGMDILEGHLILFIEATNGERTIITAFAPGYYLFANRTKQKNREL